MNIIYSPSGIIDFKHPAQGIADMSNAGFQNISLDIGLCCSGYDLENYGKKIKSRPTVLHRNSRSEAANTTEYSKDFSSENSLHKYSLHENILSEKTLSKSHDRVSYIRTPETMMQHFEPILSGCRIHALSIQLVRLPHLSWDTKRTDQNTLLEQIAKAAIHLCGRLGCRHLIVPPLFSGIEKGKEWSVNRDYYLRLAKTAQKYNVTLLLENQCRSYNGHLIRGICSDSTKAAEWIDLLNEEAGSADSSGTKSAFAFCLDTGICTLCGQDMQEFITTLGNRLQAVILRDCGWQKESSLLPFTAAYQGQPQTDWLGPIRGLRSIGFDGSLVMDFADTASAFSPLLRPKLLPLARSIASYFKWQIELESLLKKYSSIVLFGAGNMCRNYMKCYGEQYPPLFTCDNNQAIWGTQFCGLEVKPPEALKELPDNCGIFICNIYYREIEKQLQEMGIKNIEFFNDEYMPSFHFDRLEV